MPSTTIQSNQNTRALILTDGWKSQTVNETDKKHYSSKCMKMQDLVGAVHTQRQAQRGRPTNMEVVNKR